jgi:sugar O-acyltransferase (sialic acid O-acetyltransferase NeuD family)
MAKVIIFGIGQFAELAHYYLKNDSKHEVVAFTVDRSYLSQPKFKDLPVVAFEEVEKIFSPKDHSIFIPISYKNVNRTRTERYLQTKAKGYHFISYISSKATYYNTPVGENCFILENNVVQPFTEIGNNVILWSGNHIGHHSKIGDNCFIASHVVVSGAVKIEPGCFIGVNATIRDNISIGAESVIGAGSLVLKNIPARSVVSAGSSKISRVTSDKLKDI